MPVTTPYVVAKGEVIRLRTGPGQAYEIVGWAEKGESFPLLARISDDTWWQILYKGRTVWVISDRVVVHSEGQEIPIVSDIPPTPTLTPTPTPMPSPTPLPPPVLVEPESGATFPYGATIRFKFIWTRRLNEDEKVSVYLRSIDGSGEFNWWASEEDILTGGGDIQPVAGGYRFEVNSGMGNLPSGDAVWKVAVFEDIPTEQSQLSPWSEERSIFREAQ
jgi:hypothetical protein